MKSCEEYSLIAKQALANQTKPAKLSSMHQHITATVQQADMKASLTFDCQSVVVEQPVLEVLPAQATTTKLTPAQQQAIRGEVMAGLLAGSRKAPQRCSFRLIKMSAQHDDSDGLLTIPSIALAVAAQLIAVHAGGLEDLKAEPHGGHGWDLVGFDVQDIW